MRLAMLGGSFNPIHIGHMILADNVCSLLGYDKLLFVPTFIAPHKMAHDRISAEDRLEMVRIACRSDPRFEVEPCEVERGGVSYTYDTVCYLEQKYEGRIDGRIGLVLGDDLIPGFHLWRNASELSRKCDIILARRPVSADPASHANVHTGGYAGVAHSVSGDEERSEIMKEAVFDGAKAMENSEISLSSSQIRALCAEGKPFRYLVPSGVFEYIKERNLYAD